MRARRHHGSPRRRRAPPRRRTRGPTSSVRLDPQAASSGFEPIFQFLAARLPRVELGGQLGHPREHLSAGWMALARALEACSRPKARGHLLRQPGGEIRWELVEQALRLGQQTLPPAYEGPAALAETTASSARASETESVGLASGRLASPRASRAAASASSRSVFGRRRRWRRSEVLVGATSRTS